MCLFMTSRFDCYSIFFLPFWSIINISYTFDLIATVFLSPLKIQTYFCSHFFSKNLYSKNYLPKPLKPKQTLPKFLKQPTLKSSTQAYHISHINVTLNKIYKVILHYRSTKKKTHTVIVRSPNIFHRVADCYMYYITL